MPFGFWYIFQDDMIACEPPQVTKKYFFIMFVVFLPVRVQYYIFQIVYIFQFQQCGQIFGPIYQMLVDSLLRKAMYNLKESEWTPDQRESFRCYRTDIADTIMYCFNILRVRIFL